MIVRLTLAISHVLFRSFIMHWSEIALAFPYTQWSQRLYRTRYFLFSSKCVMLAKSARLYKRDIATLTHDRKCVFVYLTQQMKFSGKWNASFVSLSLTIRFDTFERTQPNYYSLELLQNNNKKKEETHKIQRKNQHRYVTFFFPSDTAFFVR